MVTEYWEAPGSPTIGQTEVVQCGQWLQRSFVFSDQCNCTVWRSSQVYPQQRVMQWLMDMWQSEPAGCYQKQLNTSWVVKWKKAVVQAARALHVPGTKHLHWTACSAFTAQNNKTARFCHIRDKQQWIEGNPSYVKTDLIPARVGRTWTAVGWWAKKRFRNSWFW